MQWAPVPKSSDDAHDDLAPVWARLMSFFLERRDAMFATLLRHDLNPPHGVAISALAAGPRRMSDLAANMMFDASYITAIVDRLEGAGIAERLPSRSDRRVKEIALTAKGTRVAEEIRRIMTLPPATFDQLTAEDRAALAELLGKVVPDVEASSEPLPLPRRL